MSTDKIPQLKALWQQAFGDPDAFVDRFFGNFFSPNRCRYLEEDGKIVSALYWFDCYLEEEKWAYLYAVATDEAHRGKGLCRHLMEMTHRDLAESGYAGAVLFPAEAHLWNYYKKLGYTPFGNVRHFEVTADETPETARIIPPDTYKALRKSYAPEGSLDQSSAFGFYRGWGDFYRGEDWLLAGGIHEDVFYAQEFLGNAEKLPGVLRALGATKGHFRVPGGEKPCGMYLKFSPLAATPRYLGFPLD